VGLVRRRPEYLLHRLDGSTPAVSVLMRVHNQWRTLEEAIRSILSQQWQDFELIVIDDGSTDRSGQVARRLAEQDARIRLLRRDRPDLAAALAEGLSAARGEFIARAAAEGTSRFHRLFEQVRYLREHPNCVLVGGAISMRDRRHEEVRRFAPATDDAAIRAELAAHTWTAVPPETALMRRSAIDAAGGYRTGTGGPEAADLDLSQRLAGIGDVSNLDSVLVWLPATPEWTVKHGAGSSD
jgi:glycosyltransferase involved in cell wall biosynthesis